MTVPLTYMRAQLAAVLRFWLVLLGAVVLLYLIGDVTENLDAWTGARGSVLLRLADVGLGLAELLLRVVGLLTAFALVFAWSRSATQGELTSVEAAGYSPSVHWLAVAPIIVLCLGSTLWFHTQGQNQLNLARGALESIRQGRAQLQAGQSLWPSADGWLISDSAHRVTGRFHTLGTDNALIDYALWRRDGAGEMLMRDPARVVPAGSRPADLSPGVSATGPTVPPAPAGFARGVEQAVFVVLMLIAAYGVLVRHGRGGGLASQVIAGVLTVTILWILAQVVDYVVEQERLRWMMTALVGIGVLTILSLFRRIRSL